MFAAGENARASCSLNKHQNNDPAMRITKQLLMETTRCGNLNKAKCKTDKESKDQFGIALLLFITFTVVSSYRPYLTTVSTVVSSNKKFLCMKVVVYFANQTIRRSNILISHQSIHFFVSRRQHIGSVWGCLWDVCSPCYAEQLKHPKSARAYTRLDVIF